MEAMENRQWMVKKLTVDRWRTKSLQRRLLIANAHVLPKSLLMKSRAETARFCFPHLKNNAFELGLAPDGLKAFFGSFDAPGLPVELRIPSFISFAFAASQVAAVAGKFHELA